MDMNIILIGSLIILIIVGPIVYIIYSNSGKNKKIKQQFEALILPHKLTEVEVLGNLIIGIDANSKILAYSYKSSLESSLQVIQLNEVKTLRLKSNYLDNQSLVYAGLEIQDASKNHTIHFYDDQDEYSQSREPLIVLQETREWEAKIRPHIGKN